MSKKIYKNPPIVEAVATFHFKSNNHWDLTAPGLVFNHLSEDFPIKKQSKQLDIALTTSPSTIEQKFQSSDRVQFYSKDEKSLIQIGPNLLSVNKLKPYLSWTDYLSKIKQGLKAYISEINPEEVSSVSLRYINRMSFLDTLYLLEDSFQIYPIAEAEDLSEYSSFISGIQVDFKDTNDFLKIVSMSVDPKEGEKLSMVLDLEYFSKEAFPADFENIINWIEIAHTRVGNAFENCIKDKLREKFGEE